MKVHNYARIIAWFFIVLALAASVSALGVSPADVYLDHDYQVEKELEFIIINNDARDMNLSIESSGELSEFISVPERMFLSANESEKRFKAIFKMPSDVIPGQRYGKVLITENVASASEGTAKVRIQIASVIHLTVPYPETYVDTDLEVYAENIVEPITARLVVKNKGTERIRNLRGVIEFYNGTNLIESRDFSDSEIEVDDVRIFTESFRSDLITPGLYNMRARAIADSYYTELGKDIVFGNQTAEIYDFTQYFIKDEINKFTIDVKNGWNRRVRNVIAEVEIEGFEKIKTFTYDLEPLEEKTLLSYWDTTGVEIGTYNATVTLIYPNATIEKKGYVHVVDEEDRFYTLEETKSLDVEFVYLVLAFMLGFIVLINFIVLLVWLIRRSELSGKLSKEEKKRKKWLAEQRRKELAKRRREKKKKQYMFGVDSWLGFFGIESRKKPLPKVDEEFKSKKVKVKDVDIEPREKTFLSKISDSYKNLLPKKEDVSIRARKKRLLPFISINERVDESSRKVDVNVKRKKTKGVKVPKRDKYELEKPREVILYENKKKRSKVEIKGPEVKQKDVLGGLSDSYKHSSKDKEEVKPRRRSWFSLPEIKIGGKVLGKPKDVDLDIKRKKVKRISVPRANISEIKKGKKVVLPKKARSKRLKVEDVEFKHKDMLSGLSGSYKHKVSEKKEKRSNRSRRVVVPDIKVGSKGIGKGRKLNVSLGRKRKKYSTKVVKSRRINLPDSKSISIPTPRKRSQKKEQKENVVRKKDLMEGMDILYKDEVSPKKRRKKR